MRFKVKDLMISTLGKGACNQASLPEAFNCTPQCSIDLSRLTDNNYCCAPCTRGNSCGPCSGGCSGCTSPCTWKSAAVDTENLPAYVEGIEKAKAMLRERIAELDAHQKAIEDSLTPSTLADVEALEAKLKEALQELARRKEELKKKKK